VPRPVRRKATRVVDAEFEESDKADAKDADGICHCSQVIIPLR